MATILILAPLFVSLVAAVLRSVVSLPLGQALLAGIPLYAVLAMVCKRYLSISRPRETYQAIGVTLVCLAPFFAPSSNGFINLGTADGGNHVRFYQSFVSAAPDVYNGFVGFYALIFLFEQALGLFPELALLLAIGYSMFVLIWILSLWGIARGASIASLVAINLMVIGPTAVALQAP